VEFIVQGVICLNRVCDGYIVLTPEELDFVRLEGWDSYLNVTCPFCEARFQARTTHVLERKVAASFLAANYRKRFPDIGKP